MTRPRRIIPSRSPLATPIAPRGLAGITLANACALVILLWFLHPLIIAPAWPELGYLELLITAIPRDALFARLFVTAALIVFGLVGTALVRRSAQRTVDQTAREARALFDGLGDPLICVDRQLQVVWANQAANALREATVSDETVGQPCYTAFHGRAEPCDDCPALITLVTGRPSERSIELANSQAYIVRTHPLVGEDGQIWGLIEAGHEVTALRQALNQAEERTALLDSLVSTVPQPMAYCGADGLLVGCNIAFAELILGQPIENVHSHRLDDLRPGLPQALRQACSPPADHPCPTDGPCRIAVTCADGVERQYELHTRTLGPVGHLTGGRLLVLQDVTTMLDTQERLRERNTLIEAMLAHLPVGVAVYQASTGQLRYSNPLYQELAGWSGADGVPVEALFCEVCDGQAYQQALRRRILSEMPATGNGRWRRLETGDAEGAPHTLETARLALKDEDLVLALARDITAQVAAEQRLADSRAHYRQLVQALGEGVWLLDNDGVTTFANPRLAEMLGTTEHELVGRPARDLALNGDAERLQAAIAALGTPRAPDELELCLRRQDGSTLLARVLLRPAVDDDGQQTGVIAAVSDITEPRRLEEQMRRVSRMEAVGRLAAGVAHDFNSILQVINGTAELLLLDSPADHPMRADVSQILQAGREGAALTSQLRLLSRDQDVAKHPIHLGKVVHEREDLLRRLLPESVTLRVEQEGTLPLVLGDPVQLGQVLINLVGNARDAMPDGGTLTVRTRAHHQAEPTLTAFGEMIAGTYACLEVADTGVGIPSELQPRIFEPFFTTKQPEEGTGLGLSQVYGIAHALNGHVVFESTPGQGTVFRVYLPEAAEEIAAPQPGSDAERAIAGKETILVVEDDPGVRSLAARVLSRLGYRVLTASGQRGAVGLAREHAGHIDLLLADVIMPDGNGPVVASDLQSYLPHLKTIYMSGYNRETLDRTLQGAPQAPLLRKPFTAEQLGEAVRSALDNGQTPVQT